MKNNKVKVMAIIYTGFVDTAIGIESIEYGIDDVVLFRWWHDGCYHHGWDRLHRATIRYDASDRAYFYSYGKRWYLDEAVRTDSMWS